MAEFAKDYDLDVGQIKQAGQELRSLGKKYGEFATDAALAAGGVLPPPFGTAADAASLGRSVAKGDWWGAAFDVVGFVPILGDAIKGTRVGLKLRDLGRMVDELATGMAKTFNKTEEAAKAFWKRKKDMKAYEDALKACDGSRKCLDAAALKKGEQYKSTPKSGPRGQWNPPDGRGDGVFEPAPGTPMADELNRLNEANGFNPPKTGIEYENGFPKFDDFSAGEVSIPQTGISSKDLELSDELYRKQIGDPNWERPSDMTWHHVEDGSTMQMVPSSINTGFDHAGGQALFGTTKTGREF